MRTRFIAGAVAAAAVGITALVPATASADDHSPTLADVLLSDSAKDDENGFDYRFWDYDIVTQAVLAFPDLTAAASNPEAELTAFLPNDLAFRRLVYEISGQWIRSEAGVFDAVVGLGLETVRDVLEYHIVPAKISYSDAKQSDGVAVPTLLGFPDDPATIEVDVRGRWWKRVSLIDADTDDRNPTVIQPNIGGEAANGYAHGINLVLRPIDLP